MIYVEPEHWKIIEKVLGQNISHFQAFGSRVKGGYKPLSDLDLVYENDLPDSEIARIMNAFEDSELPFKVDIVNTAHCSEEFKALIESDRAPLTLSRT
jgi:predicted nucleotidyltransferase